MTAINQSGPDVAGIQCWLPENCCFPSPCSVSEWEFICAVRSLLPEGEIYNNTQRPADNPVRNVGAITVGCARVGCEQLVLGGCCEDRILCDDDPVSPQLAVVDAYAAAAFGVAQALCKMLSELDPCSADLTLRHWGRRFGLVSDDACAPQWSDSVLRTLLCIMLEIRQRVITWEYLQQLAHRFGADIRLHAAGDFNCGPIGWWTMARDREDCPAPETCPPEPSLPPSPWIRMEATCLTPPDSINLVLCPSDIVIPDNCNRPTTQSIFRHDEELYAAFKWLLPHILPQPVFWCIYECDPENCIQ